MPGQDLDRIVERRRDARELAGTRSRGSRGGPRLREQTTRVGDVVVVAGIGGPLYGREVELLLGIPPLLSRLEKEEADADDRDDERRRDASGSGRRGPVAPRPAPGRLVPGGGPREGRFVGKPAVEIGQQIGGRLIAGRRQFFEALADDGGEAFPIGRLHAPIPPAGSRDGDQPAVAPFLEEPGRVEEAAMSKRLFSAEQFLQHEPQSVDVGAGVDRRRPGGGTGGHHGSQLLRAHVVQRSEQLAGGGLHGRRLRCKAVVRRPRDAEIDHLGTAVVADEDIAGLEVPMNHTAQVAMKHRGTDGAQQLHAIAHREPLFHRILRDRQRVGHELHHEKRRGQAAADERAERINLRDVRMLQPGEHVCLALETPQARRGDEPVPHQFHGHRPLGRRLHRLVNAAHPSGRNQPHDRHAAEIRARRQVDLVLGRKTEMVRRSGQAGCVCSKECVVSMPGQHGRSLQLAARRFTPGTAAPGFAEAWHPGPRRSREFAAAARAARKRPAPIVHNRRGSANAATGSGRQE